MLASALTRLSACVGPCLRDTAPAASLPRGNCSGTAASSRMWGGNPTSSKYLARVHIGGVNCILIWVGSSCTTLYPRASVCSIRAD
eukprot:7173462-Pyramimonas_sp.AAC.1